MRILTKGSKLPKKISAAMLPLSVSLLFGALTADQASAQNVRYVKRTVYECYTGWWPVREGSRFTYPSDGKWRPSWSQRCRKVTVYAEE